MRGFSSPVASVSHYGAERRQIVFQDGTKKTMPKAEYTALYQETMAAKQRKKMSSTMRTRQDGTVSVRVGGTTKGKTQVYKNRSAAKAAITRRYGKA